MKLKQFIAPIVIFLVGLVLTYVGALLKVIHFEIGFLTGNLLLTIATLFKVVAIFFLIIQLVLFYFKK